MRGNFSALLGPATGQTDALGNPVYRGAIYDPQSFSQLPNGRWIGTMFPGNIIPAARISKVSKTISAMALACCLPTVKDASGNYPLLNNAVQSASGTPLFDQYNFTEKVDQTINDRNRLSASYSYNYRPRYLNNSGGNLWDASNPLLGGPLFNQNLQQIHSSLARASWDRTISPRVPEQFHGVLQPDEQSEFQPADQPQRRQGVGHCEHR